jgi:glycosyltransferase involved in cell wall biosynthesis
VIAGHGPAVLIDRLREVGNEVGLGARDLLFTDYVDDADLRALYNLCTLHVFPSLHEGFGLPVLEAMACGAPVIGANTTSLPEVIGLEAAMFDPLSTDDIARHIEKAIVDDAFRERLREHAAVQLGKFSWDETARRALAAMERGVASLDRSRVGSASPPAGIASLAKEVCDSIPDEEAFHRLREPLARALALNVAPPRRKLLVDVTVLSVMDIGTGIQRVVRNIARCLLAREHAQYDVQLVRFEHGLGYVEANALTRKLGGRAKEGPDRPVAVYPNDVLLGLDLISHIVPVERPYFEWVRRRGAKVWFVVYDLLPVLFPHYFKEEVKAPFVPWYGAIGELASGLVCISRAVASEVRDWFDQTQPLRSRPLPVAHFHLGADLDVSDVGPVARRRPNARLTFLMVGTVEPRKGHALVLDAMERLWSQGEDVRLVVLGKPGWLSDEVIERLRGLTPAGKVVWHEAADDAQLRECYAEADALIMASEGEGFGLPLIEAAQHGVPLIARDLPVFREVAGEAAFYFSGNDPESLALRLREWRMARDAGCHPKPDDLGWLTWEESAAQLLYAIDHAEQFEAWEPGARYVAFPGRGVAHVGRGRYSGEILAVQPEVPDALGFECAEEATGEVFKAVLRDFEPEEDGRARRFRFDLSLPRDAESLEVRIRRADGTRSDFVRCTLARTGACQAIDKNDKSSRRFSSV